MSKPEAVEFEIDGQWYITSPPMDAREQLHVAKRLAPVFLALSQSVADNSYLAIGRVIRDLPDEDGDYVFDQSLLHCQRKNAQGAWGPIMVRNGGIMHDDIRYDLMLQIQIVGRVINANLGGFLTAVGKSLSAAPAPATQSNLFPFPQEKTGSSVQ
jgi:hypothetical protein